MDKKPHKNINKREFIKYGLMGLGGLVLCMNKYRLIAGNFSDFSETNKYGLQYDIWKWSKEAYYYTKLPDAVKCGICPNQCVLTPDSKGICRSRVNYKNKLYSIGYGNPCSVNVDPIEKKPFLHFLPSTLAYSFGVAGCNFSCLNCQNWAISQASTLETDNYNLMPSNAVEQCIKNGCDSIAYTYTEPTIWYEYVYDTSKAAREKGIKNVLVSNGYINEKPLRNLAKYLDAARIDLKSFKDEIYVKLNKGSLEPVLNTLKVLKEENVWIEIINLVIPNWTDDFNMIKKMCEWLKENELHEYPLHFNRFHPLYKLTQLPATPVSALEKAREIAMNAGIKYVYIGNVPGHKAENTFCPNCKKMLIERKGFSIINNYLVNGSCKFCNEKIAGVWNK